MLQNQFQSYEVAFSFERGLTLNLYLPRFLKKLNNLLAFNKLDVNLRSENYQKLNILVNN